MVEKSTEIANFKIAITTSSYGVENNMPLEILSADKIEFVLNPYGRKLSQDETVKILKEADGVIAGTETYPQSVLEQLPKLKVISRCGAGTDGIDKEWLKEKGIKLLNTPDVHITAVAELTLTGLLMLMRKMNPNHSNVTKNKWEKFMGSNLSGKTVGIIGFGRVGKSFAKLLQGFDCQILIYDPFTEQYDQKNAAKVEELESLLKQSDVLSFHIPLSDKTKNLLNHKSFQWVKKTACIINTARGGLIDERALHEFLSLNKEAGAYLDVFESEPYYGQLTELPNVVLTPHIGTFTRETRVQMEIEASRNIANYFKQI